MMREQIPLWERATEVFLWIMLLMAACNYLATEAIK